MMNTERRRLLALVFVVAAAMALLPATHAGAAENPGNSASGPAESGHVEVHGVRYYYEVHGAGEPLLLLHGGLGTIDMFQPILPALTADRKVIGVDLHGHGRTALADRPIDLADMGRDMAALVEELGYTRVDVMGYSMGGGVAAQMASQHPETVRRLALVSAPCAKDGFYPEIIEQMHQINADWAEAMHDTPMYQSYAAVAPRVEDFPKLLDAMGDMMRRPDIYEFDVEALTMPVMLVYGDGDMFRLEHIVKCYKRLGGGQGDAGWMRENMPSNRLAILPDLTHYELFMAPAMIDVVLPFLDGRSIAPSWAEAVESAR
ncbi:MAG: alpha/beta hydrolase [Ectothiorhodospiraceae bacterium]|nr:alpha/beta hydrolase [Ectothiorhodospiraceae bacterium]MCH8504215.1 alpha/beta hydrolase [Ectothiorhodospiraceae bacterium]